MTNENTPHAGAILLMQQLSDGTLHWPLVQNEVAQAFLSTLSCSAVAWLQKLGSGVYFSKLPGGKYLVTIDQKLQSAASEAEDCVIELVRAALRFDRVKFDASALFFQSTDAADVFRANGVMIGNAHLRVRTMTVHVPD